MRRNLGRFESEASYLRAVIFFTAKKSELLNERIWRLSCDVHAAARRFRFFGAVRACCAVDRFHVDKGRWRAPRFWF